MTSYSLFLDGAFINPVGANPIGGDYQVVSSVG
jgi:hypothetical protein